MMVMAIHIKLHTFLCVHVKKGNVGCMAIAIILNFEIVNDLLKTMRIKKKLVVLSAHVPFSLYLWSGNVFFFYPERLVGPLTGVFILTFFILTEQFYA